MGVRVPCATRCMMTLRAALTGQSGGAAMSEVMQAIGRDRTLRRVQAAASILSTGTGTAAATATATPTL
jgi:hypothetical protein